MNCGNCKYELTLNSYECNSCRNKSNWMAKTMFDLFSKQDIIILKEMIREYKNESVFRRSLLMNTYESKFTKDGFTIVIHVDAEDEKTAKKLIMDYMIEKHMISFELFEIKNS